MAPVAPSANVGLQKVLCDRCDDSFCNICFNWTHRGTSFKDHEGSVDFVNEDYNLEPSEKKKTWKTRLQLEKDERERLRREEVIAAEQILRNPFKAYDVENSGSLNAEELRGFLQREICQPIRDHEVQEAIAVMDKDRNGTIEFNELCKWFAEFQNEKSNDSAKMSLLRINLQAKKRARMLENQIDQLLPKQTIEKIK